MLTQLLIKKVQRSFGDDGSIFIKPDDIIDWANDAQFQIVRETNCLTTETTALANAFPWSLPANFLKTSRVLYGTLPLKPVDVESLDSLGYDIVTNKATPEYYYFIKSEMRLYPPAPTTDTTIVTIQYTNIPVMLTDPAEELTVPVLYHEDVVRFCLARAHERNENYRGYELAMEEFNSRLAGRIDESDLQDEAYSVIRDDPADWMPS